MGRAAPGQKEEKKKGPPCLFVCLASRAQAGNITYGTGKIALVIVSLGYPLH